MRLRITGCPDTYFKDYVKSSVMFYSEQLISSKRLRDNITLTIKFNPKLSVWGFASIEDYNSANKPREFLIELHPWIGAKNILRTLAHEMVHIKQFVFGETNEKLSMWKGSPIDSDALDYYLHPWEMEANSLEDWLLEKYVIEFKLWEIFEDIKNPDAPIEKQKIKWKKVKNFSEKEEI